MKKTKSRTEAARKAARTRKLRAAGRKAAITKKRGAAGRKAAATRKRNLEAGPMPGASQDLADVALAAIERHFHAAILRRAREFRLPAPANLPVLANLKKGEEGWFPVPGMYGGFAYAWSKTAVEPTLVAHSWCRIAEASERHLIGATGVETVDVDDETSFIVVKPSEE